VIAILELINNPLSYSKETQVFSNVFTENLKQQLNRQYFPDVRLEEIQPDTIKIYLKKIKQKKVPVRLQFSGTLQLSIYYNIIIL